MRTLTTLQADDVRSAVAAADRRTGLHFAVYAGPVQGPRRHFAERMHAALGADAAVSVLILLDTGARAMEIVTGEEARRRIPDRDCRMIAMSMAHAFSKGDLVGGLVGGIEALADRSMG
ncbi:DUF5130 family protein [Acrocarpospora catenulata]|uniref:DUF5130 family protein n=1 Tax=Acrocarpospora catenulata TaxID=2836182 RepID=UPI001BDB0ABC|nr:DUF5130 family protein [Acrocarpospora catenulata]